MRTPYQDALEIIAERAVSSEELDPQTMEHLACEHYCGQYFLGHPAAEDDDAFLFAVLALKTLASCASDLERAASARLLRASADTIERFEFVPAGRFLISRSGDGIKIIVVRYLPDGASRSTTVGSFTLAA